jgi:hypothetical protein
LIDIDSEHPLLKFRLKVRELILCSIVHLIDPCHAFLNKEYRRCDVRHLRKNKVQDLFASPFRV